MNFLFPAFLVGALAVAIPIALHFMRRDVAPEVPFSAVRLLHRSPIERSKRRRLRDLLLLAARVAALLLLAMAFARPYASFASGGASSIRIVAIDRSFSMGGAGRFEAAQRLARDAIDQAGSSDRVALIAFDDRADLLTAPGPAADARVALGTLRPGFGGTRYAAMFAKAVEAAGGAAGRLIVVTDLQRSGWEGDRRAIVPSSIEVELRALDPLAANAAVTDVRVTRDQLIVSLRNSGPARDGTIRVTRDGGEVASARYSAAGDTTQQVSLAYRAPAAGTLAVSTEDPGGVPADDTRHVLLDPPSRPSVLIITAAGAPQSGFYLARALGAAGDDDAPEMRMEARAVTGAEASAMQADAFARHAAVAVLSTRGLDRAARDGVAAFVRRGGGVLIAASPDVEPDVLSTMFGWQPPLSEIDQPARVTALAPTDLRHPIFRPFGALAANLGQVRVDRAWAVKPEGWDIAARFTDGSPALLERREGAGRVVLFASDLDRRWNDFPLHPVFVPFVVESVRYAGGVAGETQAYMAGFAPAGVPATPGVHRGPLGRPVVVNVDPRESALTPLANDEFVAMLERMSPEPAQGGEAAAREAEANQNWWQYGLLLMLATLVAESFVGRRV